MIPDKSWAVLLLLLVVATANGQPAEQPVAAPVVANAVAPTAATNPASQINAITQSALQGGVLSCITRVNQVANFLTSGSQSGAFLFTPATAPDQNVFSFSVEVTPPGASAVYASGTVAPNQSSGCGAVYESVAYWPKACAEVAAKHFPGLKATGKLGKSTVVLDAGAARVFLMPADKGCVSIKKEVLQ